MVEGGIRAIWNFAPVRLRLPEHIIVHNEDLYCSLASLSQKLAQSLQAKPVWRKKEAGKIQVRQPDWRAEIKPQKNHSMRNQPKNPTATGRKFVKVRTSWKNTDAKPSRLVPILQAVQEEYRYLPREC
jgi:hypothetical protein